ncbi:MAG: hypothetical protein IKA85_05415 [Clostridia bacterium]|nr:hypothetical protein [Clostridia bacterium]
MKRIYLITISIIFICLISSCSCSIIKEKNYTPNPSDYVEWDGNYFYYDNFRCATDLTVEEQYIKKISYNETNYYIYDVYHSIYKEDKLYMTFSTKVRLDEDIMICYAYMIYSLQNNKVEYLYIQNPAGDVYKNYISKILEISDDYVIFQGGGKLSKLDLTTNEIQSIDCTSYDVKYDYAVIQKDNKLLASNLKTFDFKLITTIPNDTLGFDYYIQNINGKIFVQIIDQSSVTIDGKLIGVSSLTYYDLEEKVFYEVVKFEDNKFLSINKNNTSIFILGEQKWIEYNGYSPGDEHLEYKLFVDNNILYTVTFNESVGVNLKELYVFNENEEYQIYQFENNIIHLNKRILNKPKNHKYINRIDFSKEYFDIAKLRLLNKEEHDYDDRIIIAKYANVVYYIETKREKAGFMAQDNIHYYLYRFDTETKEKGLLYYSENLISPPIFNKYITDNKRNNIDILVKKD